MGLSVSLLGGSVWSSWLESTCCYLSSANLTFKYPVTIWILWTHWSANLWYWYFRSWLTIRTRKTLKERLE